MTRLPILIIIYFLGSAPSVSADPPADSVFARGNALYDEGRYAEAADAYRSIAEAGFVSGELQVNLGLALHQLGRSGEALYHLTKAQQMDGTRAYAASHLRFVREELMLPPVDPTTRSRSAFPVWIWFSGIAMILAGLAVTLWLRGESWKLPRRILIGAGVILTLAGPIMSVIVSANDGAIVVSGPASMYDEFDSLTPAGPILNEGQTATIGDRKGARVHVTTANGLNGWIDRYLVREF